MSLPSDPLFADQWHFGLIGDIQSVWNDYTGTGVKVGVFDDGLEYGHVDLAANYDSSLHFSYAGSLYDPSPISPTDGHGTSVAGLIGAAAGNGTGGVGVAYNAALTGINFLLDLQYLSTSIIQAGLEHAANFDVMNNSWGQTPAFDVSQNLTIFSSAAVFYRDAFETVVTTGRSGLGTVIVQAAGNDGANSNGEGLTATRFNITTAATGSDGFVASYSNFGANILVAAPSASVTTDLTGSAGYSAADYTTWFGGTSAAAPIVSGVVALMLDANPQLGWRDVQNILALSAQQTGSAFGTSGSAYEKDAWFSNGADNWNGGGLSYNLSYGFGMVDVYAAVRMAEVWSLFSPTAATSANEQTITAGYVGPDVVIADNSTVSVAIPVTSSLEIENIQVTVQMQHSWAADIEMYLVAPDASRYRLLKNEGGSILMDNGFAWSFGVVGARNMDSAGTWSLEIKDGATADTGVLTDWGLAFFGAAASTNDVYHFTDDFLELAGVENGRTTLSDNDGGVDWLDFSAVSGPVSLDMSAGDFAVSGASWGTLSNGNIFENIVLGDGADQISGNSADNYILGMDGNDTLSGGPGNDTLDGGWGRDVLDGGTGDDTVDYSGATNKQKINLVTNVNIGGFAHNDVLSNIENVIGAATRGDDITGTAGNNRLYGLGADDILRGFNGDDTLYGGDNNDYLYGGRGADALFGGAGNDWAMYNDSTSAVGVSLATGGWAGYANGDTYFSIERVRGSVYDDTIFGDAGSNKLLGDGGNDVIDGAGARDNIRGGAGDDRINGGSGIDGLRGDAGADIFVFVPGNELDNVLDFDQFGDDRIDLSFTGLADYTAVTSIMSQAGTSVRLDFGGLDIMLLRNTDLADMGADDFIF